MYWKRKNFMSRRPTREKAAFAVKGKAPLTFKTPCYERNVSDIVVPSSAQMRSVQAQRAPGLNSCRAPEPSLTYSAARCLPSTRPCVKAMPMEAPAVGVEYPGP